MKKTIFTIFIIMLAITSGLNFVSAQNETEAMPAESEKESRIEEEIKSQETGHINITFDDGYNGYCIDYGKHEATEEDTFTVKDTSYAVNHKSAENVGNYLKIYFVDYYEHAMKDEIVTQHTIWHFTDDFNGWRLDYDLIENVKNDALTKTIPDHGAVRQINNTTEAVFDFGVFTTERSEHQNFFGYRITYRDIVKDIMTNQSSNTTNSTSLNNTNENSTLKENETIEEISANNNISNQSKDPESGNTAKENRISKSGKLQSKIRDDGTDSKSIKLSKHVTGKRNIGILLLLIVLSIVAIKYIKRD